jgi:hypothetical protein
MKKSYEEEEREVGSSERHYGWGEQNISSVLKVPRHCPFVLLVVLWDIKTQFVPHRRHYFSATESSQLMLCKI